MRGAYLVLLALVGLGFLAGIGWAVSRQARPPRVVVMATGPDGGAYAAYGVRYRQILAREGLEVRLRPTAGDVENLALLRDPRSGVAVALLQAGTTSAQESHELVSLGTVFLQAVWIFRRGEPQGRVFAGPRVSFGPEGSGTRAMMMRLLRLLGTEARSYAPLALRPDVAAEELLAGRIDGMALVAAWESPLVQRLVAAPDISVLSFARADAFVALEPTLQKLVLPAGVGDLARNRPPHDVTLLATKTSLVVRDDLSSAVQYLLLDAASEIHGGPGIFQKAGQFPAAEGVDVPLGEEARRFYKSGRPFLNRHLPYWMAVPVERLIIVLVPFIGIAVPLLRGVPGIYRSIMQRRIVRLYRELKRIESELEARPPGSDTADLERRAADLESRANHLRVPLSFSRWLYTLKQHIRLVRARLGEA
ncbi:TAXI family TRAP transporter solute-binding subunit [Anaeromyxobacter oryzae]|uniref:TAXI family TRAP transporter solute-binding subunit n=1 Tax=Anaeromyxobacter oryzae TaxID=2918170 RepID=UPI0020C09D4E|nr:TAXI family TRAP transporter solute-binding subunit [Anaeromyxobacter oryzae]